MVQHSQADWQRMSAIWISNGEEDCRGVIEIKVQWENPTDRDRQIALTK